MTSPSERSDTAAAVLLLRASERERERERERWGRWGEKSSALIVWHGAAVDPHHTGDVLKYCPATEISFASSHSEWEQYIESTVAYVTRLV